MVIKKKHTDPFSSPCPWIFCIYSYAFNAITFTNLQKVPSDSMNGFDYLALSNDTEAMMSVMADKLPAKVVVKDESTLEKLREKLDESGVEYALSGMDKKETEAFLEYVMNQYASN
jgi:DNA transposition AAA+ family ATPase